jgi:hypothetical protein
LVLVVPKPFAAAARITVARARPPCDGERGNVSSKSSWGEIADRVHDFKNQLTSGGRAPPAARIGRKLLQRMRTSIQQLQCVCALVYLAKE